MPEAISCGSSLIEKGQAPKPIVLSSSSVQPLSLPQERPDMTDISRAAQNRIGQILRDKRIAKNVELEVNGAPRHAGAQVNRGRALRSGAISGADSGFREYMRVATDDSCQHRRSPRSEAKAMVRLRPGNLDKEVMPSLRPPRWEPLAAEARAMARPSLNSLDREVRPHLASEISTPMVGD